MITLEQATQEHFNAFWPVFQTIIQAEETYAFDSSLTLAEAYNLWCVQPSKTFVALLEGNVVGSYYVKPNAAGPSNHIANCGYMVDGQVRGQGIAKTMCEHSQKIAQDLGFTAMQFNSVVSSNTIAIKLWEKLGFKIIGTIPDAYRHKKLGLIDSFIMHKKLK